MDELNSLRGRVIAIATEVLQNEREPYDGAKELWQLHSAISDLPGALLPFVGLASEWEDDPKHRTDYEKDITLEMERLRRHLTS